MQINFKNKLYIQFFLSFICGFFCLPILAIMMEFILKMTFFSLQIKNNYAFQLIVFAPFVEESLKFTLFKRINGNTFLGKNSIFLLFVIGFSFGAAENLTFFVANSEIGFYEFSRIITSQILHTIAPLLIFLKNEERISTWLVIIPFFTHLIWNSLIYFEVEVILSYFFALILIIYLLFKLIRHN